MFAKRNSVPFATGGFALYPQTAVTALALQISGYALDLSPNRLILAKTNAYH